MLNYSAIYIYYRFKFSTPENNFFQILKERKLKHEERFTKLRLKTIVF